MRGTSVWASIGEMGPSGVTVDRALSGASTIVSSSTEF